MSVNNWVIYDKENIFAKILRKELPSKIVFENSRVLAIKNIKPLMATHILVFPKSSIISLIDLVAENNNEQIGQFFRDIKAVADKLKLKGYKVNFNVLPEGGQEIPHLHAHLMSEEVLCESE